MSDSELHAAGVTLYNLSLEISEIGFAQAVSENKGVSNIIFSVLPLSKRPYCVVIRKGERLRRNYVRVSDYFRIGLGKYENHISLDTLHYVPLSSEEGNHRRDDVLRTVNNFMDYMRSNKERLQKFFGPMENRNIRVKGSMYNLDNSLLPIINERNFTQIIRICNFKKKQKKRLHEMLAIWKDYGSIKEENGKYLVAGTPKEKK
jgi:hypothetical protein